MAKIDIIRIFKDLIRISNNAQKVDVTEVEIDGLALRKRILETEVYVKYVDEEMLPTIKNISKQLRNLGDRVYLSSNS